MEQNVLGKQGMELFLAGLSVGQAGGLALQAMLEEIAHATAVAENALL